MEVLEDQVVDQEVDLLALASFGAGNTPPVSPPQGNNGGAGAPGS